MAHVTWHVSEPHPNPFGAAVGDYREYGVHVCAVSDADESEIPGLFVEFFRRVFEAAVGVANPDARRILVEVDTVDAGISVVVTDDARSYDEREVFKLFMEDWDVRLGDGETEDVEIDEGSFQRVMDRFEGAVLAALDDPVLSAVRAELRAAGFRLWFSDRDEETQEELPLAGL